MSKFSPLGSCQRQFSKKVESLAPTVIPRGFLNQLGFAMWTPTTRQKHSRAVTRYQTDLTDKEWRVIEPHLPKPCATGRPREWPMREIVNGIFYVMRAGCPWRLVPSDLPPWGTIYRWFAAWRDDGRFERINHALVMADRERVGRDASPSAAIIDSQSVKTTEAGGPRGYDAGKKVNGRKRHALVDTDGRGLVIEPHPASVQDRDGGGPLLSLSRRSFPFIERVFADAGFRCAFSAHSRRTTASRSTMVVGISLQPSSFAAAGRRSPAMSLPAGLTTMGCSSATSAMLAASAEISPRSRR
jgi:putative transposase